MDENKDLNTEALENANVEEKEATLSVASVKSTNYLVNSYIAT